MMDRDRPASGDPLTELTNPSAPHAGGSDAGPSPSAVPAPATDPLTATPREELSVDLARRRVGDKPSVTHADQTFGNSVWAQVHVLCLFCPRGAA